MTSEPTLSLREVSHQLRQMLGAPPQKSAIPKLLGLLKAGELMAGFEFPGTEVFWIPIPREYWTCVSSHKFDSVRYKSGDRFRIGTYQVRVSDFFDEYIEAVSQKYFSQQPKAHAVMDEFKKALPAMRRRYEVRITHESWSEYLENHPIPASALQQRISAGRPPKPSWHHLAPIIAAYLMTLDRRPNDSRDHHFLAKRVHELASKEAINDLPAVDTIRDVISRAFARAEVLSSL
jgi:hypothetical protein